MPILIANRPGALRRFFITVNLLTVCVAVSSCAILERRYGEQCKTRAYTWTDIEGFINQRFSTHAPVRTAILPFVTQANIAGRSDELPGLGNQMAWALHRDLLSTETFPLIEVLNRQDWPGRKEEFFTGNFGALSIARDAGYDLVLVGYVEPLERLDTYTIQTKIIEVESGITLWYGTSRVTTIRPDMLEVSSTLGLTDRRPDLLHTGPLISEAAACISKGIMTDPAYE